MTDHSYNSQIVNYINSWYKYIFQNFAKKNVDENSATIINKAIQNDGLL